MKITYRDRFLGVIWGVLVLLMMPGHTRAGDTIRISNGEWGAYMSEHLPHFGFWSHIVTEALALEGFTVEYGFFPWKRAISYVKTGSWEGGIAWQKTPEREGFAVYARTPIDTQCDMWFHRREYPFDWRNTEDLAGHRIGLMLGYHETAALEKVRHNGFPLELQIAKSELQNLRKLVNNRIDLLPCGKTVCIKLMRDHFSKQEQESVTYHPVPWKCKAVYLLISRKSARAEALAQAFDRGMAKLEQSGRLDRMKRDFVNGMYED